MSALRHAPLALQLALALPIAAGILGTLGPALMGDGFAALWRWPGLARAVALSFGTGVISTLMALMITLMLMGCLAGSRSFAALRRMLSPLLSVPHAAAALGLAFLVAPSGWIARALSPWATGWTVPPDLMILNDPWGLALTLGLVAKEVPFLMLMALAALPHCDAPRKTALAASLGYGRALGFALAVLPALYQHLRLPSFAVLAYAMTNVDMALILGPNLPAPLSVQITDWMSAPSLRDQPTAAAGALLQLGLVALALGLWRLTEVLARPVIPALAARGWRGQALDRWMEPLSQALGLGLAAALLAGLAGLALWSVAGLWQFPDALPAELSLATWAKALPDLIQHAGLTLAIAAAATLMALVLILAALEATGPNRPARGLWVIYLPLLVPQIAFLPGLQILMLGLGAKGSAAAVALAHAVFVAPYVYLSLAPAYRGWDQRLSHTALSLGASPAKIFWQLRLPVLLAPILTAFAVGMAVSIGQYLPSLLIGGGRVETLTTEAIALSSGGNRRLIGTYALLQSLLPFLGFALALALPRLIYRNRRALWAESPS